jgi:predicted nucleotidyltransferase component of viral defense system
MNLHVDRSAFQTLLLTQSERSGIRADILEKDYYVTLVLSELAEKQASIPAYFKGGTALYKVLGQMRRFSEDIDLTVEVAGLTKNQAKKRLESVTKRFASLTRNENETIESTGECEANYIYDSVVEVDVKDELQRFEKLKVEATSFTISEPHEPMLISPLVHDLSTIEERRILESQYGVIPFKVETIKLERIFVDKIFASEFYFLQNKFFETAKHIYDISVLLQETKIQKLLESPYELEHLINIKRIEETRRRGSELSIKKIADFSYLTSALKSDEFVGGFKRMQDQYIFQSNYKMSIEDLSNSLAEIQKAFLKY